MFYDFLLTFHNLWRWVVLLLSIIAATNAYIRWIGKLPWRDRDQRLGTLLAINLDIQFLLGLMLYFISSYGIKALSQGINFLSEPAYAQYRFFSMEHTAYMLLAVIFAHLGSILPRKRQEADHKFMRAAISFTIVFILIIYGIPWWRPLLRFFGFEIP
jgi:uncharacterized BrkB/YihY/UPF0761 family membrane protein